MYYSAYKASVAKGAMVTAKRLYLFICVVYIRTCAVLVIFEFLLKELTPKV